MRRCTARFLTGLEREPGILALENTELVDNLSTGYSATQLPIHALLESTPPADDRIQSPDALRQQVGAWLAGLWQEHPLAVLPLSAGHNWTTVQRLLTIINANGDAFGQRLT